jgi:hypothetical protein
MNAAKAEIENSLVSQNDVAAGLINTIFANGVLTNSTTRRSTRLTGLLDAFAVSGKTPSNIGRSIANANAFSRLKFRRPSKPDDCAGWQISATPA